MIKRHSHAADSDDDPLVLLECLRVPSEYYHLEAETGNVSRTACPQIYMRRLICRCRCSEIMERRGLLVYKAIAEQHEQNNPISKESRACDALGYFDW
jgi:hypothetical protein